MNWRGENTIQSIEMESGPGALPRLARRKARYSSDIENGWRLQDWGSYRGVVSKGRGTGFQTEEARCWARASALELAVDNWPFGKRTCLVRG